MTLEVTTYYLEITAPDALRPKRVARGDVALTEVRPPLPQLSRFLYTAVGGDWYWVNRLAWTYPQWLDYLDRPELETWVLSVAGVPAGYFELELQADASAEIVQFGLLPQFIGQGLGAHLLTAAVERGWARAARRVWLHTCTLDHPHALAHYQARGFRIYRHGTTPKELPEVWATDLWFSPSENIQRIRDAGVEDGVFPIHADARSLPFAAEFFDAIVCIDSFYYYGTDDLYLNYLARFVKPGGPVGIAGAGLVQEIEGAVPEHLREWWTQDLQFGWCLHSAAWWRRHWERTGIMDIDLADTLPDGWQLWLDWHRVVAPDNEAEIKAVEADCGNYLGYVRLVGRRGKAQLLDHIVSLPAQYTKKPLLRSQQ